MSTIKFFIFIIQLIIFISKLAFNYQILIYLPSEGNISLQNPATEFTIVFVHLSAISKDIENDNRERLVS